MQNIQAKKLMKFEYFHFFLMKFLFKKTLHPKK